MSIKLFAGWRTAIKRELGMAPKTPKQRIYNALCVMHQIAQATILHGNPEKTSGKITNVPFNAELNIVKRQYAYLEKSQQQQIAGDLNNLFSTLSLRITQENNKIIYDSIRAAIAKVKKI